MSTDQKRLFVLSLDGVPFTLLQELLAKGEMPNLNRLVSRGRFEQMDSVQPPISSVAWTSFMTGKTPAEHGIWGFTERDPSSMDWFVTNSQRMNGEPFWMTLSRWGKRVFTMNVPMTYPPRPLNGISICGFLGNDLSRGTYPPEIGVLLKARGYRIDSDTELARKDPLLFLQDLNDVFDRRIEAMWHFYEQEPWDFFMTHIMETDRLHHFFWEFFQKKDALYTPLFLKFYHKIDNLLGRIPRDRALLLLSDHGFTTLRKEVYLNRWLVENGFLKFTQFPPQSLKDIHRDSRAYSLYPGRIYINLKGRELTGSVEPGLQYEKIRAELREALGKLAAEDGQMIMETILNKEELGDSASGNQMPDLLAVAREGFDVKGNLWHDSLFDKTHFNGMHTLHDAFIFTTVPDLPSERLSIARLREPILNYFRS